MNPRTLTALVTGLLYLFRIHPVLTTAAMAAVTVVLLRLAVRSVAASRSRTWSPS